jgi:hypothetical protein
LNGIGAIVLGMPVITTWGRNIEITIRVFIGRPFASELIGLM